MKKYRLTVEEYNLLDNLTRQTKTDCWFCIATDIWGFDFVRDLEDNCNMPLRDAIIQLNDALIPDLLDISASEMNIYADLLNKLDIDDNPFAEEIEIYMAIYDGNANGIFTTQN